MGQLEHVDAGIDLERHRTLQRILCVGSDHPWLVIGS